MFRSTFEVNIEIKTIAIKALKRLDALLELGFTFDWAVFFDKILDI